MDDVISRQAAIDALGEEPEVRSDNDQYNQYDLGLNNQWWDDVDAIKALPPAQQWIPVTKRLPDSDDVVLVCYKDGSISTNWVCVYDNIREWVYDKEHVVAWMPLPEPWKGESDG